MPRGRERTLLGVSRAAYKDLCIDAVDAARVGEFWSVALGLDLHRDDSGDAYLTGPTPQHTVWINTVPEPKSVKHRMHLDVQVPSPAALATAGATVVDATSFEWTAMLDPEGGEFCAFRGDADPGQRLLSIVLDCDDPAPIAMWWAETLGALVVHDERGFSSVVGIDDSPFRGLDFVPVPEAKTTKNRLHIDVTTADVDALVRTGARVLRAEDDEIRWHVLADPDGNEFCAFVRPG